MFIFDFNWQIQHYLNIVWLPINFFLLLILIFLVFLAYKKPVYAVGLTIILLPTYLFRSKIWFLPFTYLELCLWITFLVPVLKSIYYKSGQQKIKDYKMKWPILLILLGATLGVLVSPDKVGAAGIWKAYFIEPILFYLVLTNVLQQPNNRRVILWSLGISTLIISLLALVQKFTGFGIAEASWLGVTHRRVTSIFTSPNAVGLYLGPIVIIYLGWLLTEIKNYKISFLKLLIIIPAIVAILFTVSQGTWLGLMVGILTLAFFGQGLKINNNWFGDQKKITLGLVATAIIIIFLLPASRQKIIPIISFADPAGQNRLILWQMSKDYLLAGPKNFIFGAGLNGFALIQNQQRDPLKMEPLLYPHNIFLNFWLETGLIGLIGFIWLLLKFFKISFKNNQWPAIAAMIAIISHGLIDVPYFKNDLAVLFWLIISLG